MYYLQATAPLSIISSVTIAAVGSCFIALGMYPMHVKIHKRNDVWMSAMSQTIKDLYHLHAHTPIDMRYIARPRILGCQCEKLS